MDSISAIVYDGDQDFKDHRILYVKRYAKGDPRFFSGDDLKNRRSEEEAEYKKIEDMKERERNKYRTMIEGVRSNGERNIWKNAEYGFIVTRSDEVKGENYVDAKQYIRGKIDLDGKVRKCEYSRCDLMQWFKESTTYGSVLIKGYDFEDLINGRVNLEEEKDEEPEEVREGVIYVYRQVRDLLERGVELYKLRKSKKENGVFKGDILEENYQQRRWNEIEYGVDLPVIMNPGRTVYKVRKEGVHFMFEGLNSTMYVPIYSAEGVQQDVLWKHACGVEGGSTLGLQESMLSGGINAYQGVFVQSTEAYIQYDFSGKETELKKVIEFGLEGMKCVAVAYFIVEDIFFKKDSRFMSRMFSNNWFGVDEDVLLYHKYRSLRNNGMWMLREKMKNHDTVNIDGTRLKLKGWMPIMVYYGLIQLKNKMNNEMKEVYDKLVAKTLALSFTLEGGAMLNGRVIDSAAEGGSKSVLTAAEYKELYKQDGVNQTFTYIAGRDLVSKYSGEINNWKEEHKDKFMISYENYILPLLKYFLEGEGKESEGDDLYKKVWILLQDKVGENWLNQMEKDGGVFFGYSLWYRVGMPSNEEEFKLWKEFGAFVKAAKIEDQIEPVDESGPCMSLVEKAVHYLGICLLQFIRRKYLNGGVNKALVLRLKNEEGGYLVNRVSDIINSVSGKKKKFEVKESNVAYDTNGFLGRGRWRVIDVYSEEFSVISEGAWGFRFNFSDDLRDKYDEKDLIEGSDEKIRKWVKGEGGAVKLRDVSRSFNQLLNDLEFPVLLDTVGGRTVVLPSLLQGINVVPLHTFVEIVSTVKRKHDRGSVVQSRVLGNETYLFGDLEWRYIPRLVSEGIAGQSRVRATGFNSDLREMFRKGRMERDCVMKWSQEMHRRMYKNLLKLLQTYYGIEGERREEMVESFSQLPFYLYRMWGNIEIPTPGLATKLIQYIFSKKGVFVKKFLEIFPAFVTVKKPKVVRDALMINFIYICMFCYRFWGKSKNEVYPFVVLGDTIKILPVQFTKGGEMLIRFFHYKHTQSDLERNLKQDEIVRVQEVRDFLNEHFFRIEEQDASMFDKQMMIRISAAIKCGESDLITSRYIPALVPKSTGKFQIIIYGDMVQEAVTRIRKNFPFAMSMASGVIVMKTQKEGDEIVYHEGEQSIQVVERYIVGQREQLIFLKSVGHLFGDEPILSRLLSLHL